MIDWVAIGQAHFESVVNMLVKKEWSVKIDTQVMPLDGRGGDQGIDIKVTLADGGLVVYQLKYFTDGISGGNRQRREQVKSSWSSVKDRTDIREWVLVLPSELTPHELKFVNELENTLAIKISIWTKAELDLRLASHPEVARYAERTEAHLEDARTLRTEQAELLDPVPNLLERVTRLGVLGSETDPNWDYDFSYDQGKASVGIRPKTSGSNTDISFSFKVNLKLQQDSEKYEEAQKIMGFALDRKLQLTDELQNISFEGPSFLPPPGEMAEMSLHPATNVPPELVGAPVSITLSADNGTRIATHVGVTEHFAMGPIGFAWRIICFHALRITFFGPMIKGASTPNPELELTPAGSSPSDLKAVLRFLSELPSTGKLEVKCGEIFSGTWVSSGFTLASSEDLNELIDFADDLLAIEELTNTKFIISENLSPEDVVVARIVRLLLEGRACAAPMIQGAEITILSEGIQTFLDATEIPSDDIYLPSYQFGISLLGIEIQIGHVEMWHPQTNVHVNSLSENKEEYRVALSLPVGQCFILIPGNSRQDVLNRGAIAWPVPRGELPHWLKELNRSNQGVE